MMPASNPSRPMTLAQAREKALEKWGATVKLWTEKSLQNPDVKMLCIGRKARGLATYYARGATWELAFADADKREAEAKNKEKIRND